MKRIAFIFMFVFIFLIPLYSGIVASYEVNLAASVATGSGTVDQIGDISGVARNGITVYIGYLEGDYRENVEIASCKPLDNMDPIAIEIPSMADDTADAVTIYVAADSNVAEITTLNIRFNTNGGWFRAGEKSDHVTGVEILSSPGIVDVANSDSNVNAIIDGEDLKLEARPGTPLGINSKVVGYSEFTWPKDVKIPAGRYEATITVEIVDGN